MVAQIQAGYLHLGPHGDGNLHPTCGQTDERNKEELEYIKQKCINLSAAALGKWHAVTSKRTRGRGESPFLALEGRACGHRTHEEHQEGLRSAPHSEPGQALHGRDPEDGWWCASEGADFRGLGPSTACAAVLPARLPHLPGEAGGVGQPVYTPSVRHTVVDKLDILDIADPLDVCLGHWRRSWEPACPAGDGLQAPSWSRAGRSWPRSQAPCPASCAGRTAGSWERPAASRAPPGPCGYFRCT